MSVMLKPWLVLAVIFIAGGLTGSALTMALSSHFMRPPGEAQIRAHIMARLTRELNLTADQQAKIQPIVDDASTKIQALHHDEVDRVSQIIKATNDQIGAILTPEQKTELQKMEADREKMFSGHMRPWGGPPSGGMHFHGDPGMMPSSGSPDNSPQPTPDHQAP